jgi:hypothetical protein
MTTVPKSKPLPHDPVLAAMQEDLRQIHAGNATLQAGIAAARAKDRADRDQELQGQRDKVARAAINKSVTGQARAHYDRCYDELQRIAQRRADATGEPVTIPTRDPVPPFPPELVAWTRAVVAVLRSKKLDVPELPLPAQEVTIRPRGPDLGLYEERGGRPTGIQPNRPDGSVNEAWLTLQGSAP